LTAGASYAGSERSSELFSKSRDPCYYDEEAAIDI